MEELIRQITFLVDENNYIDEDLEPTVPSASAANTVPNFAPEPRYIGSVSAVTEKIIEMARTDDGSNYIEDTGKKLIPSTTRCQALKLAASFPVACDENGAFESTQCNGNTCWCVDAAGNQLPLSSTFKRGFRNCLFTPIDAVEIELHLNNPHQRLLLNLYEVLRNDLLSIIGGIFDNYRVHENNDGSVMLRFDLIEDNKVDDAFAIEEMVRDHAFVMYHGALTADVTQSRFSHKISTNLPVPQQSSGIPENTFQTIVFVLATASAFLISILVVFVMLKRGKNKMKHYSNGNRMMSIGADKYLDYSSPIFVLSANDTKSLPDHNHRPAAASASAKGNESN